MSYPASTPGANRAARGEPHVDAPTEVGAIEHFEGGVDLLALRVFANHPQLEGASEETPPLSVALVRLGSTTKSLVSYEV